MHAGAIVGQRALVAVLHVVRGLRGKVESVRKHDRKVDRLRRLRALAEALDAVAKRRNWYRSRGHAVPDRVEEALATLGKMILELR